MNDPHMPLSDILALINSPAAADLTEDDAQSLLQRLAMMARSHGDTSLGMLLEVLADIPIEVAANWADRLAILDGNIPACAAAVLDACNPLAITIPSDAAIRVIIDDETECTLRDFIEANETFDAADVARFRALKVGESVMLGGGAGATYAVRRTA